MCGECGECGEVWGIWVMFVIKVGGKLGGVIASECNEWQSIKIWSMDFTSRDALVTHFSLCEKPLSLRTATNLLAQILAFEVYGCACFCQIFKALSHLWCVPLEIWQITRIAYTKRIFKSCAHKKCERNSLKPQSTKKQKALMP